MSIISQYVQSIGEVTIYSVISLLIFLIIFILMTLWTLKINKTDIQKMKNIPFDENDFKNQKSSINQ